MTNESFSNKKNDDILFASNAIFIEQLYQKYLQDPKSVDQRWYKFFHDFEDQTFSPIRTTAKVIVDDNSSKTISVKDSKEVKVVNNKENFDTNIQLLIDYYRKYGHYLVALDPLNIEKVDTSYHPILSNFGFNIDDSKRIMNINGRLYNINDLTLENLHALLNGIYANNIGLETTHIENKEELEFIYKIFEDTQLNHKFLAPEKRDILKKITEVEEFENYIHTKFPGSKRFSIEGGESFIVAINHLISTVSESDFLDVTLGMAHRGRLSTLCYVMNKPYKAVFSEFMGNSAFPNNYDIAGDVKYHMGYSSSITNVNGHKTEISLAYNPSHLEAVNTVVAGIIRAKQDKYIDEASKKKILGILVHGDAAFCGQGIVAEGLSMANLKPYSIYGIIHFIINNQIGFTANASDGRSGRYSTDIAKSIGAPILHVNGDDVESVVRATLIALAYRNRFGKDIVIDIVCYRKYGHNEGDEPMYTQPLMYNIIKQKSSVSNVYANDLLNNKLISESYISDIKNNFKNKLNEEFISAKDYIPEDKFFNEDWKNYKPINTNNKETPITGILTDKLKEIGINLCEIPKSIILNSKIQKLLENRVKSLNIGDDIDWATAEALAFATILKDGHNIRITGQDSGRGTFSHRHSVIHNQIDGSKYIPLNHLSEEQAKYFVADSNLSEYGVLGFEYGYSLVNPNNLVIWEAQFGDFANGAQIIFDQFISSSYTKWLQSSGLVVLLPHGFEGQGPEHSSARLERFLTLAAENNIQVAYPSTPASFFHLLRRQILNSIRIPLIVMTPKSLLRHKLAISKLSDMGLNTKFSPIIDEIDANIQNVKKVIFCSGKVYYDLIEKRKSNDTAIIRIEEIYPLAFNDLSKILSKYLNADKFIWCQEEPKNMGAWSFIHPYLNNILRQLKINKEFIYIGRKEAASPAVGTLSLHNKEQERLIFEALN